MRKLVDFINAHFEWFIILILAATVAIALSGCGLFTRGELPPGEAERIGLSATLSSLGQEFLFWGGLAFGAALVVRLLLALSFTNPLTALLSRIPGVTGLVTLIVETGAVTCLVGGFFVWLSYHPYVLIGTCVVTGLAWVEYRYHPLRKWLVSRKNPPTTKAP
jgi:hypothetical protein